MVRLAALLGLRNLAEKYGSSFEGVPEYYRIYFGNLLIGSGLAVSDCNLETIDREIAAMGYSDPSGEHGRR